MNPSSETTENIVLPHLVAKAFWFDYGYRLMGTLLLVGATCAILSQPVHLGWSGGFLLALLALRVVAYLHVNRLRQAVECQGHHAEAFTSRQRAADELRRSGIITVSVLIGATALLQSPGLLIFFCVALAIVRSTMTLHDAVVRRINQPARADQHADSPLHTPSDRNIYAASALLLLFTLTQANPLSVLLCAGLVGGICVVVFLLQAIKHVELDQPAEADQ